jgi:hypothetical protein
VEHRLGLKALEKRSKRRSKRRSERKAGQIKVRR